MGAQRTSFDKLQRDRAKKAKAAAKREQRLNKGTEDGTTEVEELDALPPGEELSATQLMERIEDIHARLEAGTLSFDDFEEAKAELMSRVRVD
jgi:anti-sigma28 factor (negative regulator of flagellin synthesis)